MNHATYLYKSRIIEYIKSFGSLLNIFAPIALAGLYVLIKSGKERLVEEFGMNNKLSPHRNSERKLREFHSYIILSSNS